MHRAQPSCSRRAPAAAAAPRIGKPSLVELTQAMRSNPERWQQLKIETDAERLGSTTNSPTTATATGRLRLPLSSLRSLDRRASTSSSTTTPTTTTTTSSSSPDNHPQASSSPTTTTPPQPADSQQAHQLLLQRRGSASDINIGLNRARAPSLAAIQERIARMKPDTLPNNKTDSAKPTSTTNQHSDHPPPTTPALVLPSTSSSSSSSNQTTDPPSPEKKHTQQPSKTTGDPVQQPTTSTDQGAQQPQELHPLQHSWTLYFDTRLSKRSSTSGGHATGGQAYEAGLQPIGTFQSVEQFCRFFNWTVIPSQMDMNSSVQLFKAHIKPMWEDPANSKGGKWTITMKSNSNLALLDKLWTYLVLGLVGEQIETSSTSPQQQQQQDEDFVCGAIVATRPRGNRIQIWVKEKDNVEKINALGKRLINVLEINDHSGVSVEFSAHSGGSHGASRFISIQGHGHASNTSSPQTRGANHSQTPLIRPAIEGMVIGGMGEKGMGVGGVGGAMGLMRRSTSAEVSQLAAAGRTGATMGVIPAGGPGGFGGAGGFRGIPGGATASGRGSQLSTLDPPIQNGVWRPGQPTGSSVLARPSALQSGPPGMMAAFIAHNRRPQSALNLPTIGSLTSSSSSSTAAAAGNAVNPAALPAFAQLNSASQSRQPSPAPGLEPTSTTNTTTTTTTTSTAPSSNPTRNPSPAPPAPLGLGILSGS